MNEPKDENLHKEIDLIQGVIARMAQNAFYAKGWSVSLSAVLLALGKDNLLNTVKTPYLLTLVLLVWIAFWYLDAYFLRSEQAYRRLYEFVIRYPNDPERLRYDLDAGPYRTETPTEWQLMGSLSLRVFYGIPALVLTGALLWTLIH